MRERTKERQIDIERQTDRKKERVMERNVLERKIEWEREMREREKKHLKSY